jgi:hypothetical protein
MDPHWGTPPLTEDQMDQGVVMEGGPEEFNRNQQHWAGLAPLAVVWNIPDEEKS